MRFPKAKELINCRTLVTMDVKQKRRKYNYINPFVFLFVTLVRSPIGQASSTRHKEKLNISAATIIIIIITLNIAKMYLFNIEF